MNQVQSCRTLTYKTKASIVCLGKNLIKCAEVTHFLLGCCGHLAFSVTSDAWLSAVLL